MTKQIIIGTLAILGIAYLIKKSKQNNQTSDETASNFLGLMKRKKCNCPPCNSPNSNVFPTYKAKYGCYDGTIVSNPRQCAGHGGAEWVK